MKKAWEKWKKIAQKIGDFQAAVIFSIFYFILITPIGKLASLFRDFLQTRGFPQWNTKEGSASSLEKLKRQ